MLSLFLIGSTYTYQQDLGKVPNGNTQKPTSFASDQVMECARE